MKTILIDVGRHKLRFGLMNPDDAIIRYHHELTANAQKHTPDGFIAYVRFVISDIFDILMSDANLMIAIATPGPFHDTTFKPMYMPGPKNWWPTEALDVRSGLIPQTYVFHDMAALVMSISQLRVEDMVPLRFRENSSSLDDKPSLSDMTNNFATERPNQSLLYIQASVGLGVSALIPTEDGARLPFSSEGSADTLVPYPKMPVPANPYSADSPDEWRVYAELSQSLTDPSHEFECMTALYILHPSTLAQMQRILGGKAKTPEEVTTMALKGDAISLRAVKVYLGFLAAFAGNMAYALRAYDGVYIGGSIPTQIAKLLESRSLSSNARDEMLGHFRQRFCYRESKNEQLLHVPVTLVINENNTLLGLRDLVRGLRERLQ